MESDTMSLFSGSADDARWFTRQNASRVEVGHVGLDPNIDSH